ncbi:GntR family transcriptional regulator [Oenococcus oeni]|uniref:GntR family transcriptional regulator n=3 Tax=Oenococcus oeni TaxID=1247 RepID=UPI000277B359|nr:GntR family transcriptional regulator [Oenococcus oeni]EJO05731.1 GntR family transcriptional regulator [Oenococcus oeni AWRIB422]KEP86718.1 GntR family transcriptional regulator [Oenococcus oeni IOEB_0205]KGH68632.1 GntR family transcriptional regulator [Oenococcus oeni IOEB_B16]OIL80245.1 GntR family transcriptional regulator [Oenococcus oeni]PDH76924.1 GntR family transcriptional regulator [Oenococcus oeni]
MAKYIEIANTLRTSVSNHEYKNNDPFPDQQALSKKFSTSRMTIQKALNILKTEGLIYSKQGSGTFVSSNADLIEQTDLEINQYIGTTDLFGKTHKINSKIIKFTIRYPDKSEQNALRISKKDLIYDITRLRIVDEEPYVLEYTKMPVKVIPGISDDILKKSIYHYIKSDLNLKIGSAFRKIRADKPNLFDKKFLNCKNEDPILEITQTAFLNSDIPFEFSRVRYRYDKGNMVVFVKSSFER